MYIRWLVFSSYLLSLYLFIYWLSDITITNSNGYSVSLWNIPQWIFASSKLFPSCSQFHLSFFSLSFNFTMWSYGITKSTILQVFLFVDYYKVWSSDRDYMIRLYVKIPEECVRLFLQDRFKVLHIPFVRMVKFQFLEQFPVDHLSHPVVPSLMLICYIRL